ncbi:MAG TPA: tetratricopeptide repeat protein, partial [Vicinamibacterales bacterium]|nr:tetratricopeptide repeat protein [Vicinamibacterales bacterium]
VIDRALAWFAARPPAPDRNAANTGAPYFVWIHLYDPHAPYQAPAAFRGRTATPYDDEVAYAGSEVGRLLDRLRTSGALDRTLIVVAGDHGEGLGEHGERTHGMLLYDSTLRVPLVIAASGIAARTIETPVGLSEIAPTVLHAAGVMPPPEMMGRDLIRLRPDAVNDRTGDVGGPDLYSETEYPRVAGWSPLLALTDGRWKTIRAGAATEVYDLQDDPREDRDVVSTHQAIASAMSARAGAIHGTAAAQPAISADAQERLRSLGYVASSTQPAPGDAAISPRAVIGAWNAFEEALTALNAHQPAAAGALKALAAANPGASVFQTTYARALVDAGRPQDALEIYRTAARQWPADAALMHDLAVAARNAARSAPAPTAAALRHEAERADQAAIAVDPRSATALNGLGLLAIDAGRAADAARSFERAAALDPANASYWANLGNARRASGDSAGAEQAYRRALDTDPRHVDAANGLGVLLVEAQRPADAVSWFERAVAASPDFVEARLNLGIALEQSGDRSRAADAFRKVLAAPPQYARERDAAAKLLSALGQHR